jgi:hypothetical protein
VIDIHDSYAVIGNDRAAASVRLLLAAPPSGLWGAHLCSQLDERFTGRPVSTGTQAATAKQASTGTQATAATIARLRQGAVDQPVMKSNTFQFASGSTVWRPPV